MTGLVAGMGVKAALGSAGGFLKSIPPKVWIGLAIASAALLGLWWHGHAIKKHDAALVKTTISTRDAAWKVRLDKAHADGLAWKAEADRAHATIANDERKLHDQAVASNAAVADALRLRGPGAASAAHCRQSDHPSAAAASLRHDQAASGTGAPAAQVPSDDRAIVPWNWLVQIVQEHDDLLADKKSVIIADQKQRAAWPH